MTRSHITRSAAGARMMILDAEISQVSRDRDFGRVEALVTLFVKRRGQPVRPLRVRANVARSGAADLRRRLVADAARLARYLAERPVPARIARAA